MSDLDGKRLVLFGAGKSGCAFIEQNDGLKIIAVADNDPSKQGGELCGYPIISPVQISTVDCDLIVITSVWSSGILAQLKALGLSAVPVVIPSKREMKGMRDIHPFSHSATKAVAREFVLFLNSLTAEKGIDLYLDFGTLLGAVREQDFIAWDDDIDFSVNDVQFDAFIELVRSNKENFPRSVEVSWSVDLITARGQGVIIKIFCNNFLGGEDIIPFEVDLVRRARRDGQAVAIGSMPEWYCPSQHFDGVEFIELFGAKFKAPADMLGYLDFVYGEWRTPRKNMAFSEYAHAGEVPFDDFENVRKPI